MIIINFYHPFTEAQLEDISTAIAPDSIELVIDIPSQIDPGERLAPQIYRMVESISLTPHQWLTYTIAVNLPALNHSAALVLAECYGRMGDLPPTIRLKPTGGMPPQFEFAEFLNLGDAINEAQDSWFK